ncbi:glycoside hydrolase [Desulfomarina profundi]|uniref:Glycoside hydrolase n=1 Tax=Desulfomarina profundi TaxID=2772557 RepID=A0A8D5FJR8_9BACT|nr:glycosyltransferase [Desulfomarina profundi]BCL61861.1 glycoside hydrolase [Desulfomarina profundi]
MKILVIAPEPFFTPRGTPFSVYYRSLITAQLGHKIDLITYGQGADVLIPRLNIIRIPRFFRSSQIKVGPSLYKLFLDIFMVLYTIRLLVTHRYDVVHAHEEAVFFCRFLKPFFRFKLIYDMHSSLPQQLTNFEFTSSKVLITIFKKLEDSCLKNADAVITICPDLAQYVNRLLDTPEKHFLIENSLFDPIRLLEPTETAQDCAEEKQPLLSGESKYIVYAGTLEPYQGIDILIPAFQIFHDSHPDYTLCIVGGNRKQVKTFKDLARSLKIDDSCIFTGQVSQAKAKEYTTQASILVSPRKHGTNTPLKIYEQLASGIPLVATRIYSHTQILDENVAFLVDPTPEELARGLSAAASKTSDKKAQQARALYENKYSKEIYTGKMERLFAFIQQ